MRVVSSNVFWTGQTRFIKGFANKYGGAIYVDLFSNVLWRKEARFVGNGADGGGAMYIIDGSTVGWSGRAEFTSNRADFNGGTVQLSNPNYTHIIQDNKLVMRGTTTFDNNTCGANGGALAVYAGSTALFEATGVSFVKNVAGVAGGAVFVTNAGVGLVFHNTAFFLTPRSWAVASTQRAEEIQKAAHKILKGQTQQHSTDAGSWEIE